LQSASLQYKLIRKTKDELFDEEFIHQYHLLLNIGTRDFQILVVEPGGNKVLLLEDFVLPSLTSNEELIHILDHLFDSHAFLKAGFWKKIKVAIKNQKFVQVPQALFTEDALAEYLRFNANIDLSQETLLYTKNSRSQAVTVFAINNELRNWLSRVYPNNQPTVTHQSAALIEGTMEYAKSRTDNPLYIYVDRFKLHIVACKPDQLIYYNQFAIKQFADYIKYIMMVMKSLNMDQQTSQIVLWGYIGKNSPHYHEFYKYINNVIFGSHPGYLKFSYVFDEVQEHHFFDLYSIHLLE
jgi:hypothetical protein